MTGMPVPLFDVKGRRVLVYQDEKDKEFSALIAAPKHVEDKYTQTVGTIVKLGDGFHPIDAETPEEWASRCPFQVGDRVLWSKYEDTRMKLRVEPSWWGGKTLPKITRHADGRVTEEKASAVEAMRAKKSEERVEFILLDVHQLWGIYTAPRREIWED